MDVSGYHGKKIIIGSYDDHDGIIIFETGEFGYMEENCRGAEELVDKVRAILKEKPKYELKDVQNGPAKADLRPGFFYLECFPPIDERVFNYVMYRLEQQK